MTVLNDVRSEDVLNEPFAHVVVKPALSAHTVEQLCAEIPSVRARAGRSWWRSNKRGNISGATILADDSFPACWHDFIASHLGQPFLNQIMEIMGPAIVERYPDFEERYGLMSSLRAGCSGVHSFDSADVLLDALLGFNTPVRGTPSRVRGAHLDRPDKLLAGLLYLRDPQDGRFMDREFLADLELT